MSNTEHVSERDARLAGSMYGNKAFAQGLANRLYEQPIREASLNNHSRDLDALHAEAKQLGELLALFDQVEAEKLGRVLRPFIARPMTFSMTPEKADEQNAASLAYLQKKLGVIDAKKVISEANATLPHLLNHWRSLRRIMEQNGAGNSAEVILEFAALGKRKGWV